MHQSSNPSQKKNQSEDSPFVSQQMSRRPFLTASLIGVGALSLSACGADQKQTSSTASDSASATSSPTPTQAPKFSGLVTVAPTAEEVEINPVTPIKVTTEDSTLTEVKLSTVDAQGAPVDAPGTINKAGNEWTNSEPLAFDSLYTVSWKAKDSQGAEGSGESTFSTVSAANEADVSINVVEGATYGVGQIIEFNFSEPVVNKAEIEKAIKVTGGGDQRGKMRWYSDYMARYRPEKYWAANSAIKIQANILGLDLGNGMIGNGNVTRNFSTSDKHYAFVDNKTKTAKLYVNDKLVHENLVTLGNPEWPSVVGQLVVLEQADKYFFNPTSLKLKEGDPHYYEPFWATNVSRLTESGVFVHQALPSAYPYVGVANVSHGCIGMMPEDAKYFFDLFNPGDIVETVNTDYPQADPDDGYGDWNIPFEHYQDSSWKGNW